MVNRVGERTEPCFTPQPTGNVDDSYSGLNPDSTFRVGVPIVEETPALSIKAKLEHMFKQNGVLDGIQKLFLDQSSIE